MKPTAPSIETERSRTEARRFPVTDFNFHSNALLDHPGCCAGPVSPSFRSISRDYFNGEAQHYFVAEAVVFAAIMLTAAVPLVSGAHAVLGLVHSLGGV